MQGEEAIHQAPFMVAAAASGEFSGLGEFSVLG
jgi:hypothetical protein